MADATWCPGCDSSTATLTACYENGEDCEYCGLEFEAWREVLTIRRARDDDAMAEKYGELIIENNKLKRELKEMHRKLNAIKANVTRTLGSL